jgi:hypothetical protein
MDLMTEVLVASPSESETICRDLRYFEIWQCWQVKDFDCLVFSGSPGALGAEADAESPARGDRFICELDTQGGPWILPDVIAKTLLSTLEDDKIPDLAERWLQGANAGYNLPL